MRFVGLWVGAALAMALSLGGCGDPLGFAAAQPASHSAPTFHASVAAGAGGEVPTVVWDFREHRAPENALWPVAAAGTDSLKLDGDFTFRLRLHDGNDLVERVREVHAEVRHWEKTFHDTWVSAADNAEKMVDRVETVSVPEGTEEVYNEAKKLLSVNVVDNGDAMDELEAWHEKALAGRFDGADMNYCTDGSGRDMELHITNDGGSYKPWTLKVSLDWGCTDGRERG